MSPIKKKLVNSYKYIVRYLFKMFYGSINLVLDPEMNEDIEVKKITLDNNEYKIFYCKKSRLYTDTIHDTAIIKDNMILNGPSFQYRKFNNYTNLFNDDCKKNSVISIGTPRFKKNFKGSVLSLLTGGGGNFNYWHWLFDVLPRLHILKNSNTKSYDKILFPNLEKQFQYETLDLLEIEKKKRLSSRKIRHISADQIIATSHPYNLLNNPLKDSLNIPKWIYDYLKEKFLKKSLSKSNIKKFPKKIFINRKDGTSSMRFIINSDDVEGFLVKNGFSSLTLSKIKFIDQVALFFNAELIIGLHGAGFANIIFCKPLTKIVEIKPSNAGDVIKNLAINNKLTYNDISCVPKATNNNSQNGDIEVNLEKLRNNI